MHALRGFDGIGSTLPRANRGDILAALMDFSMPDPELFREELQRVLSSASFARAERMSRLLRFLVERHLEGKDDELKESIIAVEVFGRRPDYDPKLDSTVRTEAVRLRARLSTYYSTEGSRNPLIIEVPKGGYVPRARAGISLNRESGRRRSRWFVIGLSGAIAAAIAAGVGWTVTVRHPALVSVGVLPIANLSGELRNDSFVDGLTTEIIRQVSGVGGLTVRSRTSSFALKGQSRSVREVGGTLNVEYVIEGSMAGRDSKMRITTQLVRVKDDVPLWTGNFDRHITDALAIEQEIARAIANALRWKFGRGTRRYAPEAYDLYLRARAAADVRFPGDDDVINLFEQAIATDDSLAPAYAGLAMAYAFQSFQSPIDPNRAKKLDRMRAAAERAVQLDPLLADSHTARGIAYARDGNWDLAERSFRRALEIDPRLSTTHDALARFVVWPLGRMDEALREARAADEDDPLSPRAESELAEVLLAAGRYDEAVTYCERLPPEMVSVAECIGRARLAQGRPADAIPILISSATNNWGYLTYAYAKAGRRDEAEALMATAPTRYPNRKGPFQYALVFAGFEDKDRTVEQLQRMSDIGPVRMGFTLNAPEFAFLQGDPRLKALRKQVGLPE